MASVAADAGRDSVSSLIRMVTNVGAAQILLPSAQNATIDAIATRHIGDARTWSRGLCQHRGLVCFAEPAAMPLAWPRNNGRSDREEG